LQFPFLWEPRQGCPKERKESLEHLQLESQMQKHVFLPLVSLLSHSNGAGNREAKMAF